MVRQDKAQSEAKKQGVIMEWINRWNLSQVIKIEVLIIDFRFDSPSPSCIVILLWLLWTKKKKKQWSGLKGCPKGRWHTHRGDDRLDGGSTKGWFWKGSNQKGRRLEPQKENKGLGLTQRMQMVKQNRGGNTNRAAHGGSLPKTKKSVWRTQHRRLRVPAHQLAPFD